jgi:hypothetical protein
MCRHTKHASVGDHDIDAPELLKRQAHGLVDGIDVGNIAFERETSTVW